MNVINPNPIPFDPSSVWPDPDLSIVCPDRPEPPEMSGEELQAVFGPWSNWLCTAATVKSTHIDYVALALLSVGSAVIGNTRWAQPWDGWKEPPIIWGMLVGDPSSGKSPALDAVLEPIREIDNQLSQEFETELKEWQSQDELARISLAQWKLDVKAAIQESSCPPEKPNEADAGPCPIRERVRITDATTESVADLLATSWRGLLLSRDELSGWLGAMDRYSGGGDRPFWLEAFGGRSYTVDRKGKPNPILVEHLSVSVLGGTQPDKLDSMLLHSDDDGLTARFLTVFPNQVPLTRPNEKLDEQFAIDAFKRLRGLRPAADENGRPRPFLVFLNDDAQNTLHEFRKQCREWEGNATGLMKSHVGKLPGLAVRVALVLSLLDWSVSDDAKPVTSISKKHLGRACYYVGEHLRKHAHRAYGAVSMPAEVAGARSLAKMILSDNLTEFKTREIQRMRIKGIQTIREINQAIAVLADAGWVSQRPTSSEVGRPQRIFDVNPKLEGAT